MLQTDNHERFTVLVSDPLSSEGLAPLLKVPHIRVIERSLDQFEEPLPGIDALIVRSATVVTKEALAQMPDLKLIGRAGVGTDNIDVEAATERGVIVVNAPDGNTISTCEHTFAMMMALMRNIPQAHASVRSGEWNRKKFEGAELYGKTLGIIGFGRIGSEIAARARAFRMKVMVYDPFLTAERANKAGVKAALLEDVLEQADILTVHTPLVKETRGLINRTTIARMKKGAFLLNCARGGIVDEAALAAALESGQLAGAALDVFESEPLGDSPLRQMNQVILTPHIAASTKEAQQSVARQVSEEIIAFSEGRTVTHGLNFPHIPGEQFDKIRPFYDLAVKMGKMASNFMRVPVKNLSVSYSGEIAEQDTTLLTRAALKGFFKNRIDSYVNDVNVSYISKERGVSWSEKRSQEETGYQNLISITVEGEDHFFSLTGTSNRDFGLRFLKIDDFSADFQPSEHQLFISHTDKPGVIGSVGQLLGTHDVNIATMHVGRKSEGGEAMMMLTVDKEISSETASALQKTKEINRVIVLEL
ncbi:phosphoglycerate dehydrogenase [Alteribacter lacisalsi]|uniref:phosphoglycerate dehydrogenase n=1 Tax=Alteribacter lacisalsi TaxID=2045244 RepID=UPI001F017CC3|nr:phosphoglycerate dehydrogenase [Alteribacter lacisalsi]